MFLKIKTSFKEQTCLLYNIYMRIDIFLFGIDTHVFFKCTIWVTEFLSVICAINGECWPKMHLKSPKLH